MLPGRLVIMDVGEYKRTKDPRNPFKGPFDEYVNPFLFYSKINATLIKSKTTGGCYNESFCNGIIGKLVKGEGHFTVNALSHLTVNQTFMEECKWPGLFYGPMMGENRLGFLQLNYTSGYVNQLQFGLAEVDCPVYLIALMLYSLLIILNFISHMAYCKTRRKKCRKNYLQLLDPFSINRSRMARIWHAIYLFLCFQFLVDFTNSDLLVWISPKYHKNLAQLVESKVDILSFWTSSDKDELLWVSSTFNTPQVHSKLVEQFKQKNYFQMLKDISKGSVFAGRETSCSYMKSTLCTLTKYKIPFAHFYSIEKSKSKGKKTPRHFRIRMRVKANVTKEITLDLNNLDTDRLKFMPWKHISNMFALSNTIKNTPLASRVLKMSQKFVESGVFTRDLQLLALRHAHISAEKMYNCMRSDSDKNNNINRSINRSSAQYGLLLLLIIWGFCVHTILAFFSLFLECIASGKRKNIIGPAN